MTNNKTKYLFVGDLHGDVDLYYMITSYADKNNYQIVQLGDLVDSRTYPPAQQLELVEYCIDRKRDHGDIYLLGNHDLSYLHKKHMCSGYNSNYAIVFEMALKELKQEPFFIVDNVLATHAGFHPWFIDMENFDNVHSIEQIREYLIGTSGNILNNIFESGVSRGGWLRFGGITWNDWIKDFRPINNVHQVLGHTARQFIEFKGEFEISENYNIDCLQFNKEVLEYDSETKMFVVVDIL